MQRDETTIWPKDVVFTVGHSNITGDAFVGILQAYGIERLIDIRTMPRSRHNPQFNSETLELTLRKAAIGYRHMKALGGLRRARADSHNTAWRNGGFRGYADYMQTAEFKEALAEVIVQSKKERPALMCAEAVPWRCHRSLVADALNVRGVPVIEIFSEKNYRPHTLTSFARLVGDDLVYPGDQLALL